MNSLRQIQVPEQVQEQVQRQRWSLTWRDYASIMVPVLGGFAWLISHMTAMETQVNLLMKGKHLVDDNIAIISDATRVIPAYYEFHQ